MSLLEKISSPSDLRRLDTEQLPQLCKEIREYLVQCCAVNPGHLGSSLGAVEIAVAVHYVYNTPHDKLIWDVGHQAYAHKLLTGRREAFVYNRKLGGLSGFPNRHESKYDAFGTGHSSTSISAALGFSVAASLRGTGEKCVAVIGDGAMTGGLAFEGLNNAGATDADLLVILNDNGISIDKNSGALSNHLLKITTSQTYNRIKKNIWDITGATALRRMIQRFVKNLRHAFIPTPSGPLFTALGFRYFGPVDGNDVLKLVSALQRLKEMGGPRLLHVVTKKGKGYMAAEADQVTWHAPGLFDPLTGKRIGHDSSVSRYQDVFGETLLELARADERIVGVTPAMASGCGMNLLMKEIPSRCFDVGIAEGHAVTFSAGLAAAGMLPFCNIYSSFAQRAYDNIVHDVVLQGLKVVLCFDRSGLVGEDGATHHGVLDIPSLRSLPGLTICSPLNEVELRNMMYSATLPSWGPVVIRYPRGYGEGLQWRNLPMEEIPYGKAHLISEGRSVAILSLGPLGNRAEEAALKFEADYGCRPLHYNMRFVSPVDTDALKHAAEAADVFVTIEDGNVEGGLFGAVSEYVAANAMDVRVIPVGVKGEFIPQGTQKELYHICGSDIEGIYAVLQKNFKK